VDELAETRLALDNGVRDAHLAAEGGQPHNDLDNSQRKKPVSEREGE
jgi:hypothetical protein